MFKINFLTDIIQMNPISQFTLYDSNQRKNKHPSTHKKTTLINTCQSTPIGEVTGQVSLQCKYNSEEQPNICQNCQQYAKKLTQYRKKDILSQYQNEKLKDRIEQLSKDKKQLIQQLSRLTSNLLSKQNNNMDLSFNRQDLQAQLFQAKFLIQFLQLNKQYKKNQSEEQPGYQNKDLMVLSYRTNQTLLQKNHRLLIENFQLQEKIMIQDKIIKERNFYPIYHYDQRILMLRKSIIHWQNLANKVCSKLQKQIIPIKQSYKQILNDINNGRHMINQFESTILQEVDKIQKRNCKPNSIEKKQSNKLNISNISKTVHPESSKKQDTKKPKSKKAKKIE